MAALKRAQAVADVEQGIVLATVEIAATPERVFEALVRSEDVTRWWQSAEGYKTTEWTADVRKGGLLHAGGTMPNGTTQTIDGEFTEVEAPHRLGFTWRPGWDPGHETHVAYMLEAIDGGTRLTLRHTGFAGRADMCRNHGTGWQRVVALLEADFRKSAPPVYHFLFKLLPPRASFMMDMSAEERTLMGVHSVYWRGQLAAGKVIAFGPVADPAGGWGVGLMRVDNTAEATVLTENDPVILADKGFKYELLPMPNAVYA
jgi:uncharacterized protein YndB with AHSA1/START domain